MQSSLSDKIYEVEAMPSYFNENPSTDICCNVEFTNKSDKTRWLKIYEISLFCHSAKLPHSVIDDNELPL